jgi:hypothetical protein
VQVAKTEFLSLIHLSVCVTILAVTCFISPCFSADPTSQWASSSLDEVTSAAQGGNASAQWYLGYLCCIGQGVQKNWTVAASWFRAAADRGNMFGQNDLGTCYYTGQGVEKSLDEAIKWYRLAADNGHPSAAFSLGWLAEKAGDIAMAKQWYNLALKHGHPTAAAKLQSLQGQPAETSSVPVAKRLHATDSDSTLTARTESVPSSPTETSAVPSSWWSEVNDLLTGQYTVCGVTYSKKEVLICGGAVTVLLLTLLVWNGCRCQRSGATRDSHNRCGSHNWVTTWGGGDGNDNITQCTRCQKVCSHVWEKVGETRVGYDVLGSEHFKCSICGTTKTKRYWG